MPASESNDEAPLEDCWYLSGPTAVGKTGVALALAEQLEAEDPFFKKVRDSQKAYADEVMPYRLTITELYQTIGETYFDELVGADPS